MDKIFIKENYVSKLNIMETEIAIKLIKDVFEKELSEALNLTRISAPLFVLTSTGLNDGLSGIEKPVAFVTKENPNDSIEIVHSLAKWKRMAIKRYDVEVGSGIYTDMNAIRKDEELDNIHSIYVDQWDWEKVITVEKRNIEYLKEIVNKIYSVFLKTEELLVSKYNVLPKFLSKEIFFITSQELEDQYKDLTAKERENEISKKHGSVFILQIGKTLKSGEKHDDRAPDYDDWELNGDIIIWNEMLGIGLELSSMGIRVNDKSLTKQLLLSNIKEEDYSDYHNMILKKELPLTIGGGIGQSRMCMLFLQKIHIGEVQASIWSKEIEIECEKNGIKLL